MFVNMIVFWVLWIFTQVYFWFCFIFSETAYILTPAAAGVFLPGCRHHNWYTRLALPASLWLVSNGFRLTAKLLLSLPDLPGLAFRFGY